MNSFLESSVSFAEFEFDTGALCLTHNGQPVAIGPKPLEVLRLLIEHAGEIVSRDDILEIVWRKAHRADHTNVTQAIWQLRRCFGPDGDHIITTVPRQGYRFVGELTPMSAPSSIDTTHVTNTPAHLPQPRLKQYTASALALVAGLTLLWLVWQHTPFGEVAQSPVATVAVLGFQSEMGTGPQQSDWRAIALAHMLSLELMHCDCVTVLQAATVADVLDELDMHAAGVYGEERLNAVGTLLGADYVVYGTLESASTESPSSSARLSLKRVATGDTPVEVAAAGPIEKMARTLSLGLREHLGRSKRGVAAQHKPVKSTPPTQLRQLAEAILASRQSDYLRARRLLEQALADSPASAELHAMLAQVYSDMGYVNDAREQAELALQLAIDVHPVERLLVEARYYTAMDRHEDAIEKWRALLARHPADTDVVLWLGEALLKSHKLEEALALVQDQGHGMYLDPRILNLRARALARLTRIDEALDAVKQGIDRAIVLGANVLAAELMTTKAEILMAKRDTPASRDAALEALAILSTNHRPAAIINAKQALATASRRLGFHDQAERSLKEALELSRALGSRGRSAALLNAWASIPHVRGEFRRAEQLVRQALEIYLELDDPYYTAVTLSYLGTVLLYRDQSEDAAAAYNAALSLHEKHGHSDRLYYSKVGLAEALHNQGKFRQARELFESQRQPNGKFEFSNAAAALAFVCIDIADMACANQSVRNALDVSASEASPVNRATALWAAAEARFAQGRFDVAEALVEEAVETLKNAYGAVRNEDLLRLKARILAHTDRSDAAIALLLQMESEATRGSSPSVRFRRALDHAEALRLAGRPADAKAILADAEPPKPHTNALLHARHQLEEASALEALGQHAKALTLFDQVYENARNVGFRRVMVESSIALARNRAALGQPSVDVAEAILEAESLGLRRIASSANTRFQAATQRR